MWVERVAGNVAHGLSLAPGPVDYLDIRWDECGRLLKSRTREGRPIRVLLPPGNQLRHGDVLSDNNDPCQVIVNVLACDVIVARPTNPRDMSVLCLELGNLHWPTQVTDAEVLFIEDGPPMAVLEQLKVPWNREPRRFEPTPIGAGPGVQVAPGFKVIRR
jgi:urease accessory protein UreE